MWMKIRNTFIIFIVSGFWHGANWTFIIWGLLNAIYIMPSIIFKTNRNNLDIVAKGKYLPTLKEIFSMAFTFGLTLIAWIFFRAKDVQHAFSYIKSIGKGLLYKSSYYETINFLHLKLGYFLPSLMVLFILIEWIGREQQYAIANFGLKWYKPLRWAFYYTIVLFIFLFAGKEQQFIYFQF